MNELRCHRAFLLLLDVPEPPGAGAIALVVGLATLLGMALEKTKGAEFVANTLIPRSWLF